MENQSNDWLSITLGYVALAVIICGALYIQKRLDLKRHERYMQCLATGQKAIICSLNAEFSE